MEEQTKDLQDYINAVYRRRLPITITVALLFTISLVTALLWPPTYRSTATILIEAQEIPSDLVRSTVTTYALQRIQTISQRAMTRSNLTQIMDKYNLYVSERRRKPSEEILTKMRENIKVEPIRADVVDPRSGQPTQATIAFTLSFDGESPAVAQKVTNELTTLYLNENLRSRTEKAAETFSFLSAEADKLRNHIAELEAKLADFKEKNVGNLPELRAMNMQMMERTDRELMDIDNQINLLKERKFYLEGQLAQINPLSPTFSTSGERIMDVESRLKTLRNAYIIASARYASDHPDLIQMRREIEGLEKQAGRVDHSNEQAKVLSNLRAELAAAEEKYSTDHPDVIRLKKEISAIEAELEKESSSTMPETKAGTEKPDNPAYITLKAQLEATIREIESQGVKREQAKARLAEYETKIVQSPQIEREYLALTRDRENAIQRYQQTKAKQMEAQVGQELEKERKGERFSLIDPPQLPEEPIKPNRPAIIFMGFILSLAGGIGYAAVAESLDSSIRGAKGVTAILDAPLLSVIPYKENREDIMRRERRKKIAITAAVSSMVLVVILIHFLWTPLDVLWFRGLRKVDNVIGG